MQPDTWRVLRRWLVAGLAAFLVGYSVVPSVPFVPPVREVPTYVTMQNRVDVDVDALVRAETIAALTLEQKIALLFVISCPGTDPAGIAACVNQFGAGGVILMGGNVSSTEQLAAVRAAMPSAVLGDERFGRFIAIDQEGGVVSRMWWDNLPAGYELANDVADASAVAFGERSTLLEAARVSVNFGIVADVPSGSGSFMWARALGQTATDAADRVAAAVTGERVASTLKHWPGHGAAEGDSHITLPTSPIDKATWQATHALPFVSGVAAGAELVMSAHVLFPAIAPEPASLSPEWYRILREEVGFTGVAITDDLLMLQDHDSGAYEDATENASRALAAGADVLLMLIGGNPASAGVDMAEMHAAIAAKVRAGEIPESRVNEALDRLLKLLQEIQRAE